MSRSGGVLGVDRMALFGASWDVLVAGEDGEHVGVVSASVRPVSFSHLSSVGGLVLRNSFAC